ncbi:MAG: hypothetical protein R2814_04110 [Flavobacteriaceae bacterium]
MALTSCTPASENELMQVSVVTSIKVCSFIPAFALRKVAHQNTPKHRTMVVESKA